MTITDYRQGMRAAALMWRQYAQATDNQSRDRADYWLVRAILYRDTAKSLATLIN